MFISYVKEEKLHGSEELSIHMEHPHVQYLVKIFVSEMQNEVVFKKVENNAFIIISNGQSLGSNSEEEFEQLLDILEIAGVKLLEKTIKPRVVAKKLVKIRPKKDKNKQMDRLLDRYNDYGYLYTLLGDEKYKRKQERLMGYLRAIKKPKNKK